MGRGLPYAMRAALVTELEELNAAMAVVATQSPPHAARLCASVALVGERGVW